MGGAEGDCCLEIGAHAHGEQAQPVALCDLGGERKMRRRRFVIWRNTHQPGNFEAVILLACREKGVGILRQHA